MILFSGCAQSAKENGSESIPSETEKGFIEYEYTSGYTFEVEPFGSSRLFSGGFEETIVCGNIYQFDPDIQLEERSRFIDSQMRVCEAFTDLTGQEVAGYIFRVFREYPDRSDSDAATGYFGMDSMDHWQQALVTAQTVLGDDANYGFLYALADDIAGQLGWAQDDREEVVDWKVFEEEPMMLSLVYPCFQEPYSTAEEITAAKALSLEIYEGLDDLTEEAFAERLQDYALDHQIAYTPTYLKFSYNGEYCKLRIRSKYLDIWFDNTYKTDAVSTDGWEEDWLSTVSLIVEKIEEVDTRLGEIRKLAGYEGDELVQTQFTHEIPSDRYSGELWGLFEYRQPCVPITVTRYSIIPHEYGHYIFHYGADSDIVFDNSNDLSWKSESFAQFCGIKAILDSMVYKHGEEYFDRLLESSGVDAREPAGYIELNNEDIKADCEKRSMLPKDLIGSSYPDIVLLSLAEYIVQEYGEETFVQVILHPGRSLELTGRIFVGLMDDWSEFIMK